MTKPKRAPKKNQWEIERDRRNELRKKFAAEVSDVESRLLALSNKTMNGGVYASVSDEADAKNLNNAEHSVRCVRIVRRGTK